VRLQKIRIVNFKCFEGEFELEFNKGVNIIVGDNEAGKSTILEAIHLALTGLFSGRNIGVELSQYMFNTKIKNSYINSIEEGKASPPPYINIEIFFDGSDEELALCSGDGNEKKEAASGVSLKICFNEIYCEEYESFISLGKVKGIPIEYYDVIWTTFARKGVTARSIPLKSFLIDSSNYRYQNCSDVYITRIIRDRLEKEEIVSISQAYRQMREEFMEDISIKAINEKINEERTITDKSIQIAVDLATKNAWENILVTELDNIPFHFVGKGTQCIVKTELALSNNKAKDAGIILLEEPENHLSHANLNCLISHIKDIKDDRQIIMTTHSSFVANKLGLDRLVLINNGKSVSFDNLKKDTKEFFEKIAGYDTLRLVLSKKAILVEGASDELVVQKAFMVNNGGKLPIEMGIDVISVGLSFLRFLEIADILAKPTVVVTDNDGSIAGLMKKYDEYLGDNKKNFIDICFDLEEDSGPLTIEGATYNYNTLEPKMLKANGLDVLNKVFDKNYKNEDELLKYCIFRSK
jgi:putative ATP-dependent endonuclease of OLD family